MRARHVAQVMSHVDVYDFVDSIGSNLEVLTLVIDVDHLTYSMELALPCIKASRFAVATTSAIAWVTGTANLSLAATCALYWMLAKCTKIRVARSEM